MYLPCRHPRAPAHLRHTLARPEPQVILRRGGRTCLNGFGPPTRFVARADAVVNHRKYFSLVDIPPNNHRRFSLPVQGCLCFKNFKRSACVPACAVRVIETKPRRWVGFDLRETEIHFSERPALSLCL